MNRVLRLPEVKKVTELSRSAIYLRMEIGDFPKQFKLGPKAIGWMEHEISDWINSKYENRT